eukprot:gene244-861_t
MPGTREDCKRETVTKKLEFDEKPGKDIKCLDVNGEVSLKPPPVLVEKNGEVIKSTNDELIFEALNKLTLEFKERLKFLQTNDQIKELQTTLRDRETSRSDFIFYADRLIRLVVEEGLNQLPFDECSVTTPTGAKYKGLRFRRGICGVSIVRSGEAMEKGLRECCRSIRIGKVLLKTDEETSKRAVCYAKFPPDIDQRKVFLMYPLLSSGGSVAMAVDVLLDSGVEEENIIILTLFSTFQGVSNVLGKYKKLKMLTTEVYQEVPKQFGRKYFGTD